MRKYEQWVPPEYTAEDAASGIMLVTIDPRADHDHIPGRLPCPGNPPPPVGWEYWKERVTNALTELAAEILHGTYPIGTFVQKKVGDKLVGARVEWHTEQGSTGHRGCFRGVNLMQQVKGKKPS